MYYQFILIASHGSKEGERVGIKTAKAIEVWLMDDNSEEAVKCLTANFYSWMDVSLKREMLNNIKVAYEGGY